MSKKPVIVYGASGYTGRLVCEYLRELGIPFIAAGRDKKRVQEVMDKVPGIETASTTTLQHTAAIIAGVEKNKFVVYTSFDTRFGYWWKRKFALPYEVVMRIANNRFSKLARTSA